MSSRSFLLLMLVCVLWAMNMIVSRLVVGDMGFPPLWFAALRSVLVLLVLLPWLRPLPPELWKVLLITFAVSGGGFALLFIGLKDASVSAASIVSLSSAPLTVLFAILFLGEKVHWRRGLGILLTLCGVVAAMASPGSIQATFGLVLVFVSALVNALGAVFLKRLDLSPLRLQAWAGASSTLALVPLSLFMEGWQGDAVMDAGWDLVAALAFSTLGVSVLAHTLYFRLLQKHDANVVAPLTLVTPVFTILMGVAITGDTVTLPLILGGLIAAAGVLVIVVRPSTKLFKPLLVRGKL